MEVIFLPIMIILTVAVILLAIVLAVLAYLGI